MFKELPSGDCLKMAGSSVQWQKLSEEGGPDPITLKNTSPSKGQRSCDPDVEEYPTCGIFGWRPHWLQRFATPNTFFAIVCACLMVEVAAHTGYVGGVLSTIEKNFQVRVASPLSLINAFPGDLRRCHLFSYMWP